MPEMLSPWLPLSFHLTPRTVLQSEFSPFAWRLGFIWNQRGSHSAAAPRREGEPCCGHGGRVTDDGNGGFDPFSSHHLETVRASWSHAGVLCSVGAPTVPTFDINTCPGEIYAQPY